MHRKGFWAMPCGCAIVGGAVLFISTIMIVTVLTPMLLREGFVPMLVQGLCAATDCRPVRMAVFGWLIWVLAAAVAGLLWLARRRGPRWLFRVVAVPGGLAVWASLMFTNPSLRRKPMPTVAELVGELPGGPAFDVGIQCGKWALLITVVLSVVAWLGRRDCAPRNVWLWQIAQLAIPVLVFAASLVLAVRLA